MSRDEIREGGQRGANVEDPAVSSDCLECCWGVDAVVVMVWVVVDGGAELVESPNIRPKDGNVDAR